MVKRCAFRLREVLEIFQKTFAMNSLCHILHSGILSYDKAWKYFMYIISVTWNFEWRNCLSVLTRSMFSYLLLLCVYDLNSFKLVIEAVFTTLMQFILTGKKMRDGRFPKYVLSCNGPFTYIQKPFKFFGRDPFFYHLAKYWLKRINNNGFLDVCLSVWSCEALFKGSLNRFRHSVDSR